MSRRRITWIVGVLVGLASLAGASRWLADQQPTRFLILSSRLAGLASKDRQAEIVRRATLHAEPREACLIERQLSGVTEESVALGYLNGILQRKDAQFDFIPLRLWRKVQGRGDVAPWYDRRLLQTTIAIWVPEHPLLHGPPPHWSEEEAQQLRAMVEQLWHDAKPPLCPYDS